MKPSALQSLVALGGFSTLVESRISSYVPKAKHQSMDTVGHAPPPGWGTDSWSGSWSGYWSSSSWCSTIPPCTDVTTTVTTSGSPPGTTTIPPATTCGTETIIVTTCDDATTTITTSGSPPGTTTIPPATTCGTETIIVTTCTDATTTITTSGSPPGTTTIPPATTCGTETVIVSTCTDVITTITTPGSTSGTVTILPATTCGTETIIVTTPTPTSCPIQPDCPPSGLNIDYYENQFGYNGYTSPTAGQSEEEVLPPSYYLTDGLEPLASSITNVTYIPQDYTNDIVAAGYPVIYPDPNNPGVQYFVGYTREVNGGIVVNANNYTLVYEGFYRAPTTGEYTFCSSADNVNYFYLGDGLAFDCGSGTPDPDAPALTVSSAGGNYNNPISCGTVQLTADEFYPIRDVFGNGDAVSAFNLTIQAPGESPTNDNSGRLYPVDCRLDG